jgi:hypothetical protein
MKRKDKKTQKTKLEEEQFKLLEAECGTVKHFFGSWEKIFENVRDWRDEGLITYPLSSLLFTGVLMYLLRLGARRQIKFELKENENVEEKYFSLCGVDEVPHGDTLNYAFQKLSVEAVQEVLCQLVDTLIRKKVLNSWRLLGKYFEIAIDGTGELTFDERHCEHCLTKTFKSGKVLYYHPVLEAKLLTPNGFAFSIMTEFIENPEDLAEGDKQDCEFKAFKRLAKRLKKRFPRLPICLLLDGLFANGPLMQICEDNKWKYITVLKDGDLKNLHRSFEVAWGASKENHKKILIGKNSEIVQEYRWENDIEYCDSEKRVHHANLVECVEEKEDGTKTKHLWITNIKATPSTIDAIANHGGRLRWKIENEGFNVQKNGGYNLEHAYSRDPNARKVFYLLLQIAHLIFQLIEKGSLFRKAFPKGFGSQRNLAKRLLEAWRNLQISSCDFCDLGEGRFQIRFDTS